jgi:hypothetical protein
MFILLMHFFMWSLSSILQDRFWSWCAGLQRAIDLLWKGPYTELYYRENPSHCITNFRKPLYVITKMLIRCMPSVSKNHPSCHSCPVNSWQGHEKTSFPKPSRSSILCLLSSLSWIHLWATDPDMFLFLSESHNIRCFYFIVSQSPSWILAKIPVQSPQETSAHGMQRETRGVPLELEDEGRLPM